MSYHITDPDDMFLFFSVIERAQPDTIMDLGAFMVRIGAVSRNVKDKYIPKETRFDCFTFDSIPNLLVYSGIYDSLYKDIPEEQYQLAMMIEPGSIYADSEISNIISWAKSHASFLLTDRSTYDKYRELSKNKSVQTLGTAQRQYCLVSF